MVVAQYVLGGVLIALAVALVAMILMQTGKEKGLSGTITGSADTYFGKSGGSVKERLLFKLTIVGSAIFVVLTIALVLITYVIANQPTV
jgi:preprotein translocase subunit SecG